MPSLVAPKAPKPAPVTAPAVMPTQDDAAVMAAKRQKQAALMSQSGRASTIYSQGTQQADKFGA